MTKDVTIVVTQKSACGLPQQHWHNVWLAEASAALYGSRPRRQLLKLKTRTTCLTDASLLHGRSGPSLAVRGQGTYALLSDKDIEEARKFNKDIDFRDDPADWQWYTTKD